MKKLEFAKNTMSDDAMLNMKLNEEEKGTKIKELKDVINSHQASLSKHIVKSGTGTKVSYLIAEKLAKKGKPLVDGELIKECISIALKEYCLEKISLFNETCLSQQTIGRRISDLGNDVESKLMDRLSTCVLYSLALDASVDFYKRS